MVVNKKKIWDNIGGFDPIFCPAYIEDVDFCGSVRKEKLNILNLKNTYKNAFIIK